MNKTAKADILNLSVLTVLFFCFVRLFYAKQGSIFYDTGKEFLFPQLILEGKILYKDLFNLYGPFTFQFNALLYKMFGVSSNVILNAGVAIALGIMYMCYFITRKFSSSLTSFVTTIVAFILIFKLNSGSATLGSYLLPYSFSISYAFLFALISIGAFFKYITSGNVNWMYLCAIFIGLDFVTKLDFLGVSLFILGYVLFDKNIKTKEKCVTFIMCTIPSIICWGMLIAQGLTFSDFIEYFDFIKVFQSTKSITEFNKTFFGLQFSLPHSIYVLSIMKNFVISAIPLFAISYFLYISIRKLNNKLLAILLVVLCCEIFPLLFSLPYGKIENSDIIFCWFSYPIIGIVIYLIATKYFSDFRSDETKQLYLLTIIFSLLVNIRYFWNIQTSMGGNFSLLLYFIVFVVFCLEILAKNDEFMKKTIAIFFIALSVKYIAHYTDIAKEYGHVFNSPKGYIVLSQPYDSALEEIRHFLNIHATKESKVLMVPESPMVGFFMEVKTNERIYSVIPHWIEAVGEEKMLESISDFEPDYIILTVSEFDPHFTKGWFGRDIGENIYMYIRNKYEVMDVQTYRASDSRRSFELVFYKKR